MYILGIHNDEDAGVCLMRDDTVLISVSEERFSRTKLHKGLPKLSLQFALDAANISLQEIDHIAYGWHGTAPDARTYAQQIIHRIVDAMQADPGCGQMLKDRIDVENKQDMSTYYAFKDWMAELGISTRKVHYLDHHTSHAWAAYGPSPFDKALVVTMDGRGDLHSGTISLGDRETGLQPLDKMLTLDSLGYLYGKITAYLGFKPHRHEGKVTGLAAHGDPEKTIAIYRSLISWNGERIESALGRYKPFFSITDELKRELDKHTREDIAAGLQQHCEELVCAFVGHWLKRIPAAYAKHICLAGGLFANVKINQFVAELPGVESIFVFPHMGDGGLPAGSAFYLRHQLTGESTMTMPTILGGPAYEDDAVAASLAARETEFSFNRCEDTPASVVADLIDGKVVGHFSGNMEYGPRALGSRSILFRPDYPNVNDWLNERLHRTEFMPFAPVTPEELAAECYIGWKESDISARYMTRTYDCTPEFIEAHPGVVHVDGTARPQVLTEAFHKQYYEVVRQYCEKTGKKALINTSFNQHEEPIVCTPDDALSSLANNNVDVLYVGSYRVTNKG